MLNYAEAKKSSKKKKEDEVSIIKKGWDDVTTRNNYFFNAKQIYDELVKSHKSKAEIDYQDTLPYYFHDVPPSFEGSKDQLQKIIIKTGVVLQRHDYSRWKDNCYTLLGKAYFLEGKIDSALINFQYVSTALRGKFNDTKVTISQKDILKAKIQKQKQLKALAKDKKKELEEKRIQRQKDLEKEAADKTKRLEAAKKAKEKELQRKIKAKKKMLKQKAKGKYKAPKTVQSKESQPHQEKEKKKTAGDILDKVAKGISIDLDNEKVDKESIKKSEQKIKALEYTKEKLEAANVVDSLTEKQRERMNKLSLWEKIKHLRSRPEALVWMTKSYIKLGQLSHAESIVEYSKTLLKLRKVQKKEINLVRSYYYYTIGDIPDAATALEQTIPFIKKKTEKDYYKYLLAQLESQKNPESAYQIFKNLHKKAKDEILAFNALEKMYQFEQAGLAGAGDKPLIIQAYNKSAKSQLVGDKALYTLASISLKDQDTAQAIAQLYKALTFTSSPDQKGKALTQLAGIYYDQFAFKKSYIYYDSASSMIAKDTFLKAIVTSKAQILKHVSKLQEDAQLQDSLLYLSTLSRAELADYIKAQNKIERKKKRREEALSLSDDGSFTSSGMGNDRNFNLSQDQFTSKSGQWYFYNADMRSRGFNEFKRDWGNRPYVNDWRRGVAIQQNSMGMTHLIKKQADTAVSPPLTTQFKIPTTDEEKAKANEVIAESYMGRAKDFYNKLSDEKVALIYLDSLINRYPKHKLVPEALYLEMMIYKGENQTTRAKQIEKRLLQEFPDSEWSQKILNSQSPKPVQQVVDNYEQASRYYANLYQLYQDSSYRKVISSKLSFVEKYPHEDDLIAKLDFLVALSYAQIDSLDKYSQTLREILRNYPKTPEAEKAKFYLTTLQNQHKKEEEQKNQPVSVGNFKFQDGPHYIIISLKDAKQNNMTLVEKMNALMDQVFPQDRIRSSNSYLNAQSPYLLVKTFADIAKGKQAMKAIRDSKDIVIRSIVLDGEMMLISQDNFRELFLHKKLEDYQTFYKENYK